MQGMMREGLRMQSKEGSRKMARAARKPRADDLGEGAGRKKRRKALVYDRDAVEDAGDAVKLARKDGKAALGCKKVRVLPETAEINGDLIVEVEEKR